MIMEILVLIQVFILGWVCHSFYMAYKVRRILKNVAEENGLTLQEMTDRILQDENITVKVPNYFTEKLNDNIMLYNKDTGKFTGQARTMEELAENFYKFEKVKYALVNHDSLQFWFVEGKIRKDLKEIE